MPEEIRPMEKMLLEMLSNDRLNKDKVSIDGIFQVFVQNFRRWIKITSAGGRDFKKGRENLIYFSRARVQQWGGGEGGGRKKAALLPLNIAHSMFAFLNSEDPVSYFFH